MSLRDFAQRVGLKENAVRRLARTGRLPEAEKVGRCWDCDYDAPERFLARRLKERQQAEERTALSAGSYLPLEVVAQRNREARALRARRAHADPAVKERHRTAVQAAWDRKRGAGDE